MTVSAASVFHCLPSAFTPGSLIPTGLGILVFSAKNPTKFRSSSRKELKGDEPPLWPQRRSQGQKRLSWKHLGWGRVAGHCSPRAVAPMGDSASRARAALSSVPAATTGTLGCCLDRPGALPSPPCSGLFCCCRCFPPVPGAPGHRAHTASPLGFPSLFALISGAPSLLSHCPCLIPALTLFITKVTGTAGGGSRR